MSSKNSKPEVLSAPGRIWGSVQVHCHHQAAGCGRSLSNRNSVTAATSESSHPACRPNSSACVPLQESSRTPPSELIPEHPNPQRVPPCPLQSQNSSLGTTIRDFRSPELETPSLSPWRHVAAAVGQLRAGVSAPNQLQRRKTSLGPGRAF